MDKQEIRNAMFQFATNKEIFVDTGLITITEAKKLFEASKEKFIDELNFDRNPEMCIWIDCETSASYGNTLIHWVADDIKIIDGEVYIRA